MRDFKIWKDKRLHKWEKEKQFRSGEKYKLIRGVTK
jgi:hypothetical protein